MLHFVFNIHLLFGVKYGIFFKELVNWGVMMADNIHGFQLFCGKK